MKLELCPPPKKIKTRFHALGQFLRRSNLQVCAVENSQMRLVWRVGGGKQKAHILYGVLWSSKFA